MKTTLNKIKELRKQKGLTLKQLADKIGSSKSYIWELENEALKRPSAEKLYAIAKELGVTIDYFLDNEQTKISEGLTKEMYFRKIRQLDEDDQRRIMDIIDVWGKK